MPPQDAASQGWLGILLLAVGLLLCFVGARSLRLAGGCAGFGLGSGVVVALGGSPVPAISSGRPGPSARPCSSGWR